INDLQMLNRAALLQPLAKAAAGAQLHTEIGGVLGESVGRAPPMADLAECGIDALGRCRDRRYCGDLEAVWRSRFDLSEDGAGNGKNRDQRDEAFQQHRSALI